MRVHVRLIASDVNIHHLRVFMSHMLYLVQCLVQSNEKSKMVAVITRKKKKMMLPSLCHYDIWAEGSPQESLPSMPSATADFMRLQLSQGLDHWLLKFISKPQTLQLAYPALQYLTIICGHCPKRSQFLFPLPLILFPLSQPIHHYPIPSQVLWASKTIFPQERFGSHFSWNCVLH